MHADEQIDLGALVQVLVADVGNHAAGRTARTVVHGTGLRAVVMALDAGRDLADHTAPGPATLQVLRGELELRWADTTVALAAGTLHPIPDAVHSVHALTPCAFLLTVSLPG